MLRRQAGCEARIPIVVTRALTLEGLGQEDHEDDDQDQGAKADVHVANSVRVGGSVRIPCVRRVKRTIAICLALAVAGCGDEESDVGPSTAHGSTELEITLDADGPKGKRPLRRAIACEAGASEAPCAVLTVATFAPVATDVPCTEIYGGADEVAVEGTVAGESLTTTFTRANGCEIDRFDRLLPLLSELFPAYRPGASLR